MKLNIIKERIKLLIKLLKWAYAKRKTSVVLDACAIYDLSNKKNCNYTYLQALTFLRKKAILLPRGIYQQVERLSNNQEGKSRLFKRGHDLIKEIIEKKQGTIVGSQKTGLVNYIGQKKIGSLRNLNLSKDDFSFCRRRYKQQVADFIQKENQGQETNFHLDVCLDDNFANVSLKQLIGLTDLRVIASTIATRNANQKRWLGKKHQYVIVTRDKMLTIVARSLKIRVVRRILDI